ncbi:MAG: MATE family efflux transporter [Bacilli bacterium]|nr:MATE family efflux transporter [Bacilli bacterium]
MCSGNLFWKMLKFSMPLAAMGVLQLLYNAADLLVVSNFSDNPDALGAVGSTSSLINLTVNLFMGLSVGTNVVCAKLFGAKNTEKIKKVVHTSILISLIVGIFLSIFGFVFAEELLHMMSNDSKDSALYLKIYFLGMPFNLVYNFAASILRAVGDTKRPLYFLTISGIINVILNLFFVLGFNMDVDGVAIATVISQVVSCILIIVTLCKTNECYKLNLKELKIYKKELWEITKVGLPAGIQGSLFSISNVLIQSSVNKFGFTVMNGNSAASSIEGFVYVIMNSVHHAALSFTGQNLGAKKQQNIKKVMIYSLIIVTMIGIIFGGSFFLLGEQLLSIYTKNPSEIEVGLIRLWYLCLPYFLYGLVDVMVGDLRGLGSSTTPMIVSILGICGIRILWIYFVFNQNTSFTNVQDLHLLYISYPITWIVTFTIHLICYIFIYKKVKRRLTNQEMVLD